MEPTEPKPESRPRKGRWFQFSLRTLLVFVLVWSVLCSWLAVKMRQAEVKRQARSALLSAFVLVRDVDDVNRFVERPGPRWLRDWLGDEFFSAGYVIDYASRVESPDQVLSTLPTLPGVKALWFSYCPAGDASLTYVEGLVDLEEARLDHTQVTDRGMASLRTLFRLRFLDLSGTRITDAGLKVLERLTDLEELHLAGTSVTDAGLVHLKPLSKLKRLNLMDAAIAGDGLTHLEGLTNLEELSLCNTAVSDKSLPHLYPLKNLTELVLQGTEVTDEAVERLQQALPSCEIER